jgi:hypothetical protein
MYHPEMIYAYLLPSILKLNSWKNYYQVHTQIVKLFPQPPSIQQYSVVSGHETECALL